jgi:hypothetical protein
MNDGYIVLIGLIAFIVIVFTLLVLNAKGHLNSKKKKEILKNKNDVRLKKN